MKTVTMKFVTMKFVTMKFVTLKFVTLKFVTLTTVIVSLLLLAACGSDVADSAPEDETTEVETTGQTVQTGQEATPVVESPTPAEASASVEPVAPADGVEPGVFVLSVDGAETVGSGVVFEGDGDLHLRGLAGSGTQYFQLDHIFTELDQASVLPPLSIAEVFGGDATAERFRLIDADSSLFQASITEEVDGRYLAGNYRLMAVDLNAGPDAGPVEIEGNFHLPIGASGDWNCDFDGPTVTACGFSE